LLTPVGYSIFDQEGRIRFLSHELPKTISDDDHASWPININQPMTMTKSAMTAQYVAVDIVTVLAINQNE
jgi:hypothetical protein